MNATLAALVAVLIFLLALALALILAARARVLTLIVRGKPVPRLPKDPS